MRRPPWLHLSCRGIFFSSTSPRYLVSPPPQPLSDSTYSLSDPKCIPRRLPIVLQDEQLPHIRAHRPANNTHRPRHNLLSFILNKNGTEHVWRRRSPPHARPDRVQGPGGRWSRRRAHHSVPEQLGERRGPSQGGTGRWQEDLWPARTGISDAGPAELRGCKFKHEAAAVCSPRRGRHQRTASDM